MPSPFPVALPGRAPEVAGVSPGDVAAGGRVPSEVELVGAAAARVAARLDLAEGPPPALMVVLGSGMRDVLDALGDVRAVPVAELSPLPVSGVEGHGGLLARGRLAGLDCLVQVGRVHLYEGCTPAEVVRAVRAARALGVRRLLLTAAAGGLRRDLVPGTLMRIEDQLNLTGCDPLSGAEGGSGFGGGARGGRFTDLSRAYDPALAELLDAAAAAARLPLARGVYAGRAGPSYETPAEIRMLAALGADAVGMSTVLEVIAAVQAGLAVAGLCCITNRAAGLSDAPLSHAEVLERGRRAAGDVRALLLGFAEGLRATGERS